MTLFFKCKCRIPILVLLGAIFFSGTLHAQEKYANQQPAVEFMLKAATDNKTMGEPIIIAQNQRLKTGQQNFNPLQNVQSPATNGYGDNVRNNRPRLNVRQQRLEEELRSAMSSLGCVDAGVQDAVLEYIREETKARRPLVEQSRRLFFILRTSTQSVEPKSSAQSPVAPASPLGGMPEDEPIIEWPGKYEFYPDFTNEQFENDATLSSQIIEYRAALDADRTRHKAAEVALDNKIKFSQNPRLEAMLLLMGIVGDSPNLPLRAGAFSSGPARPPAPRNNPPANVPPVNEPALPNVAEGALQASPNNRLNP